MDTETRTQRPTQCPYCRGDLAQVEQHDWLMSQCSRCGGLWLEGHNLAQMIQNLHLTHLDSDQAFSELGTIVRRTRGGRTWPARAGSSR